MGRLLKLWLVGVLAGAAVFGGWACSDDGGDELSLEEYFQELDELENEFTAAGDASFEDVPEEPEVSDIEDALSEFTGILDEFVADIEGLNPPDEAQDVHDATVAAGLEASEQYNALVESVSGAESVDAIFESEDGEAVIEALDGFTAACVDLQKVADDNEVDVDLNCDDDEE